MTETSVCSARHWAIGAVLVLLFAQAAPVYAALAARPSNAVTVAASLRDTGECDPTVGLEEPIPCTTNGDCAGLGPGTCTSGFCDYPTPTPCTTNTDCTGLGTGRCHLGTGFCDDQHYHLCRPGATNEGEWNLSPNGCGYPEDSYNGGCNATGGEAFGSVSCGETVCGSATLEVYGTPYRDTDWYKLVVTEPTRITVSGTAEFDWVMGLAHNHGIDDCVLYDFYFWGGHYVVADACTSGTADACVHAGTWWIAVVPQWTQGTIPCLDYELTVECESPCQFACCVANGQCIETDEDTCETSDGCIVGPEYCSPGLCDPPPPPPTEFPCNTEQLVDNTVNSYIAIPPMSCASGDSVGVLWWWFTAESDSVQISTCNSVPAQGGDSVFALYEGPNAYSLTEIDCSEDEDCGPGDWLGVIRHCGLVVGDSYYVQFASWDAASQGTYLVQIDCPYPGCAPAACCLSDGGCVTASLSECEAQSGAYQDYGAQCAGDLETNGIDDACEFGACCTAGTTCELTSPAMCQILGGLDYFPGETCDPNPCQGACCRKTGIPPSWVCSEVAEGGCPGDWYEGQQCVPGDWPWFDCPDDVICTISEDESNCQRPLGEGEHVEGTVAVVSDENPILVDGDPLTQRIADDFVPHASGINQVCWWGLYADIDTNAPAPAPVCYWPTDDFTITFYDDANGCPGTVVAQYGQNLPAPNDLIVAKTNAGWTAGSDEHQVWEYEGTLGSSFMPTPAECYWIEIVNNTDDGSGTQSCVWYWSVTLFAEGNGFSVMDESLPDSVSYDCTPNEPTASTLQRWDMAFCLNVPNDPCDRCAELLCAGDPEGEPICYDDYEDMYNQGCNVFFVDELPAYTTQFTDIGCNQEICGTFGTFTGQPRCRDQNDCEPGENCVAGHCTGPAQTMRDTDWYRFEITDGPRYIEWCFLAEPPVLTGIINTLGLDSCPPNLAWALLSINPGCVGGCEGATFGNGIWYGYMATLAFEGVPCGAGYELLLDCPASSCDCAEVRSYKTHGANEWYINTGCDGSGGVESRIGGLERLEMDVDDASSFGGGVTVTCVNGGDMSAAVTGTSVAGDTVTVNFVAGAIIQDTCTVELDCGASACVQVCEGDLQMDGRTSVSDAVSVKIRFGLTVDNSNCQWDFNCSDSITAADSVMIKIRFGWRAPDCP